MAAQDDEWRRKSFDSLTAARRISSLLGAVALIIPPWRVGTIASTLHIGGIEERVVLVASDATRTIGPVVDTLRGLRHA